jgi:threonine/homoserine/homoserine lactone efflux protein
MIFCKGFAFGFLLAAAVGPMWVLCLRRTLAFGRAAGLASGLGIAVADGLYGAVAAFGLTAVSAFLLAWQFWIGLAAGVFLLWLGFRMLVAEPPALGNAGGGERPGSHAAAFVSTLALTLANPPTILAFAAVFASLGLTAGAGWLEATQAVAGVFLGSAAWWLVLAAGAGGWRPHLRPGLLRGVNVVAGLFILVLATWQLRRLF